MKQDFVFKYEKFMGREGIGLYLNNDLISFTYDSFGAFAMIILALRRGDNVECHVTEEFLRELSKREREVE